MILRRISFLMSVILLTLSTAGCAGSAKKNENVHSRIHTAYYDINSYSALCSVSAYTKGGRNTYECTVSYQKDNEAFVVESDEMTISLDKNKAVISDGDNVMETPPGENDMCIFVNTFFKSYYESESTSLITSAKDSDCVLLECDLVNPTKAAAHMKLWINRENVLPEKMQVFDKDDFMNTEIIFKEFKFEQEL